MMLRFQELNGLNFKGFRYHVAKSRYDVRVFTTYTSTIRQPRYSFLILF